jgi:hypothetical protein
MNKADTATEYLKNILAEMERLTRKVVRLKEETARFKARIEPFEGEETINFNVSDADIISYKPKDLDELLKSASTMRAAIRSFEFDFTAIRGKIDNIARDGISRDEMKPWLKD